jgi:hypothetical protein
MDPEPKVIAKIRIFKQGTVVHVCNPIPWRLRQKDQSRQELVAHTCNPSYSGGTDQEDQGSKPAWAIVLRPYLEKTHHKKRAQGVGHELFKPQNHKKIKRKKKVWNPEAGLVTQQVPEPASLGKTAITCF